MNIEELRKQLSEARSAMQTLVDTAKAESRNLSGEEAEQFDAHAATIEARKADIARAERAEVEARAADEEREAAKAREDKAAEARRNLGMGDSDPSIRVGAEERTYRKGGEFRYFQDLAAAAVPGFAPGSAAAQVRLARHAREMEVEARAAKPGSVLRRSFEAAERASGEIEARTGLTTSVGSGGTFLPPEYLLHEAISYPRQARVAADLVRRQDLPRGPMTINIPKITGPTAVAPQNGQNTAATEQDLTDAYVSASVVTWAGQQTVSLQAIEQSAIPFDEIVFEDLNLALDLQVEGDVVNGSGSAGHATGIVNTAGITSVTYTSGSPTQIGAWPYIGQAKAKVFDSIFRAADVILMTPDRWGWFEIARDGQNRPLVTPDESNGRNLAGNVEGQLVNAPKPVGRMFGLPIYVTTALPTNLGAGTNQDEMVICSIRDLILWESAPIARALPQTLGNQLSVLLQVYEYGAFMPNRLPGAISVVGGTGLVTPVYS